MNLKHLDKVVGEFNEIDSQFAVDVSSRLLVLSEFVGKGISTLGAKAIEVKAAFSEMRAVFDSEFAELRAQAAACRELAQRVDPPPAEPTEMVITEV